MQSMNFKRSALALALAGAFALGAVTADRISFERASAAMPSNVVAAAEIPTARPGTTVAALPDFSDLVGPIRAGRRQHQRRAGAQDRGAFGALQRAR